MEIRHTGKLGSILWLLLAVGIFVVSADLPAGTGETGPAFYPRVIAVLIAVFALLQFGRSVHDEGTTARTIRGGQAKTVGIVTLLVTIYVLSLPWLGFVTATVVFLVVAMVYSGARSIVRIGGAAIALSLLLYYLFGVFLRVPLPESPLIPVETLLPGIVSLGQGVIY